MYGTYRYGERTKKEHLKMSNKKVSNLYEKVKRYVLYLRDLDEKEYQRITKKHFKVLTKEEIAKHFNVKPHEVEQVFRKLNMEGILQQPVKNYAHDTNRDPHGFGGVSGWAADEYHFTPSYLKWSQAVWNKDYEKLKTLIERGFDVNTSFRNGFPLMDVMEKDNLEMVQHLLDKGANPIFGGTLVILAQAIQEKSISLLELLFAHTKNPFIKNEDGNNLLHLASSIDDYFIPFLLDYGFPMNEVNNQKETALILAVLHEKTDVVRSLLEKGANIKKKDMNKKTAFMYAYEKGDVRMMKLFVPYHEQMIRDERKLFKKVRLRLLF